MGRLDSQAYCVPDLGLTKERELDVASCLNAGDVLEPLYAVKAVWKDGLRWTLKGQKVD